MFLLKTTFCTQGSIKIISITVLRIVLTGAGIYIYLFKVMFFFNNSRLSTNVCAFVSYRDTRLYYYILHHRVGLLGELTLSGQSHLWTFSILCGHRPTCTRLDRGSVSRT